MIVWNCFCIILGFIVLSLLVIVIFSLATVSKDEPRYEMCHRENKVVCHRDKAMYKSIGCMDCPIYINHCMLGKEVNKGE